MAAISSLSASLCAPNQSIKGPLASGGGSAVKRTAGGRATPLSTSLHGKGLSIQVAGPATRKGAPQRWTPAVAQRTHTVQAGDICYDIWNRYGISEQAFYSLNPGINCNNLQIGQKVVIGNNQGPSGNVSSDIQAILNAVNSLRARHHAPPVSWDNNVAAYAQNYANKLIATGEFKHSGGPYGENLFAGGGFGWTVQQAIDNWYSEVKDYDFNKPGFSGATGHFTALVWRNTSSIGVGVGKGNGRTVITMNFSPPGNVLGQFPKNVLRP